MRQDAPGPDARQDPECAFRHSRRHIAHGSRLRRRGCGKHTAQADSERRLRH